MVKTLPVGATDADIEPVNIADGSMPINSSADIVPETTRLPVKTLEPLKSPSICFQCINAICYVVVLILPDSTI